MTHAEQLPRAGGPEHRQATVRHGLVPIDPRPNASIPLPQSCCSGQFGLGGFLAGHAPMRLRRGGVDIFNRPTRHLNAAECGPMRADPARPRPDEAATDARALGSVMARPWRNGNAGGVMFGQAVRLVPGIGREAPWMWRARLFAGLAPGWRGGISAAHCPQLPPIIELQRTLES